MGIRTEKELENYQKGLNQAEEILNLASESLSENSPEREQSEELKNLYQSKISQHGRVIPKKGHGKKGRVLFPGLAEGYLDKILELGLNHKAQGFNNISPRAIYEHVAEDILKKTNPDLISHKGVRKKLSEYEKQIDEGQIKNSEIVPFRYNKEKVHEMENNYKEKSAEKPIKDASIEDIKEEAESFSDPEDAATYLKNHVVPEIEEYSSSLSEDFKNSFYETLGETYERVASKKEKNNLVPSSREFLKNAKTEYEKSGKKNKIKSIDEKIKDIGDSYEKETSDS